MTLTLIRHGATPGNAEKRYIGKSDEALSDAGIREVQQLKAAGRYPAEPELVFSSPLKRCLETAELIYPTAAVTVIDTLREMDFGEFEGRNYAELNGNPQYQAWIDSDGIIAFPGGEDRAAFIDRCVRGLKELYAAAAGRDAVAVVHGGTIMALLSAVTGGEYWSYQTGNGQGWTMHVSESDGTLTFTNMEKR